MKYRFPTFPIRLWQILSASIYLAPPISFRWISFFRENILNWIDFNLLKCQWYNVSNPSRFPFQNESFCKQKKIKQHSFLTYLICLASFFSVEILEAGARSAAAQTAPTTRSIRSALPSSHEMAHALQSITSFRIQSFTQTRANARQKPRRLVFRQSVAYSLFTHQRARLHCFV